MDLAQPNNQSNETNQPAALRVFLENATQGVLLIKINTMIFM
jgi:hypothetical protein